MYKKEDNAEINFDDDMLMSCFKPLFRKFVKENKPIRLTSEQKELLSELLFEEIDYYSDDEERKEYSELTNSSSQYLQDFFNDVMSVMARIQSHARTRKMERILRKLEVPSIDITDASNALGIEKNNLSYYINKKEGLPVLEGYHKKNKFNLDDYLAFVKRRFPSKLSEVIKYLNEKKYDVNRHIHF